MKRIELLENLKDSKDIIESGISFELYWAYKKTRKIGLEILNFDNIGFVTNHKELIENLERFGIEEFTISDKSDRLANRIAKLKERGYSPSDTVQIETGYTYWNFEKNIGEKEYISALYFKKN